MQGKQQPQQPQQKKGDEIDGGKKENVSSSTQPSKIIRGKNGINKVPPKSNQKKPENKVSRPQNNKSEVNKPKRNKKDKNPITEQFVPYENLSAEQKIMVDNARELLGGEQDIDIVIMGLISNNWDVNRYVDDTFELIKKKPGYRKENDLVTIDLNVEGENNNNNNNDNDKSNNLKQTKQRQNKKEIKDDEERLKELRKLLPTHDDEIPVIQMNHKKYGWGKGKPKEEEKKNNQIDRSQQQENDVKKQENKGNDSIPSSKTTSKVNPKISSQKVTEQHNSDVNDDSNIKKNLENNKKNEKQDNKEEVKLPQEKRDNDSLGSKDERIVHTKETPKQDNKTNVPITKDKIESKNVTTETDKESKPIQKTRSQQTSQPTTGNNIPSKPIEKLIIKIGLMDEENEKICWEKANEYKFGLFELEHILNREEREKKNNKNKQEIESESKSQKVTSSNINTTTINNNSNKAGTRQNAFTSTQNQKRKERIEGNDANLGEEATKQQMKSNKNSENTGVINGAFTIPQMITAQSAPYGMLYQPLAYINSVHPPDNLYTTQKVTQFVPSQNQFQNQGQIGGGMLPSVQINRNIKAPIGPAQTSGMIGGTTSNNNSNSPNNTNNSNNNPSNNNNNSGHGIKTQGTQNGSNVNPIFNSSPFQQNQIPFFVNPCFEMGIDPLSSQQNQQQLLQSQSQQGRYFISPCYYVQTGLQGVNGIPNIAGIQPGSIMGNPNGSGMMVPGSGIHSVTSSASSPNNNNGSASGNNVNNGNIGNNSGNSNNNPAPNVSDIIAQQQQQVSSVIPGIGQGNKYQVYQSYINHQ